METRRCEKCGEMLTPGKEVWLEYSITDDKFYEGDQFPEGHESQGMFCFGSTCAKDPKFGDIYS